MTAAAGPADLAAWLAWLEARNPTQINLGLDRVAAVWARLGLAFSIPVITVAGTNGKGSTCAFLDAMLRAGGYRVGLYTSPHLLRYNERVRVDGAEAADDALCTAFAAVEAVRFDTPLSYFEQGTLAALWLFAQAKLDVLVLEVGLGGRLDAVNILAADCAVITPVDLDHQAWLGNDREAIGYEKAGITRAGRPLVCSDPAPPASVLATSAAPLWLLGREITIAREDDGAWACRVPGAVFSALPRPALLGAHQYRNAAAALAALWLLRARLPLPVAVLRSGIATAQVAGRFQVIGHAPLRILDVAHNPHAARTLAGQLADLPPTGARIAVCAMLGDKDVAGVVAALCGVFDRWYIAPLEGARAAPVTDLAAILAAAGCTVKVHSSVTEAWHAACCDANAADTIAAFGSFYTVAAVVQTALITTR
jgi:dihydrofolate synthase / folylpolyglutamate synthase